MKRVSYSEETKGKCIELKEKDRSYRTIMEKLTVQNITKIRLPVTDELSIKSSLIQYFY